MKMVLNLPSPESDRRMVYLVIPRISLALTESSLQQSRHNASSLTSSICFVERSKISASTLAPTSFAHGDTVGDANQVRVLELHARPLDDGRRRARPAILPASRAYNFSAAVRTLHHPCWRRSGPHRRGRSTGAGRGRPRRDSAPRRHSGSAPRQCRRSPSPAALPCRLHRAPLARMSFANSAGPA